MPFASENLTLLLPEIIVVLTGVLIVVLDLAMPQRPAGAPPRHWLAYVGVAGLAGAALANAYLADAEGVLYGGVIVHDALSVFFTYLFLGIGSATLLLSTHTVPRFSRWNAEYYALVVWCTMGHMILTSTGELFTIFITMQLTSLPLIVLIGYAKRDPKSGEAALKYLLLVLVSTAVLVYGMSLVYGSLGTSTIAEIGARLAGAPTVPPAVAVGLVLLLTGFAFKITAAPFHWWVPDTYEGAPTPTTAFMSVGSKFAGFALALRIIVTGLKVPMEWALIFGTMAALSMTLGNLGAIRQTNIKRMLAYSGIAQAGYLLIGLASLTQAGVAGVLYYAAAYSLANLAAFGVVLTVARTTGTDEIEGFAGLHRRAPLVALAGAVALLSLAGLPLFAGFMAKFYVFLSAAESGLVWLVVIGVVNSVIALYYYLRVVFVMYVRDGDTEPLAIDPPIAVALTLCVTGVLAFGLFPESMLRAAVHAASALFGG